MKQGKASSFFLRRQMHQAPSDSVERASETPRIFVVPAAAAAKVLSLGQILQLPDAAHAHLYSGCRTGLDSTSTAVRQRSASLIAVTDAAKDLTIRVRASLGRCRGVVATVAMATLRRPVEGRAEATSLCGQCMSPERGRRRNVSNREITN